MLVVLERKVSQPSKYLQNDFIIGSATSVTYSGNVL